MRSEPVRWNAAEYHRSASAQTGWGREVHARLALAGDETVFDLGCGDGRLSAELADRVPRGAVVGMDSDPDMIAFARRTYARGNLVFAEGDARTFAVPRRADLVVSTACLHWVAEHEDVLRRCRAHLAAGGRIVFQMGGRGCCREVFEAAAAVAARPRWARWLHPFSHPWHYPGPEDYREWLPRCGFRPDRVALVEKDMVHSGRPEILGWVRTTWMPVLARVPEPLRFDLAQEIVSAHLRAHPPDVDGATHTAMVRLEVEATAD